MSESTLKKRLNQKEQIKQSSIAYIIKLNNPDNANAVCRFQVYLLRDNKLYALWPSDSHEGRKTKELIPGQVYSTRKNYPAYHFALDGYGYSMKSEIENVLKKINPSIQTFELNGGTPS